MDVIRFEVYGTADAVAAIAQDLRAGHVDCDVEWGDAMEQRSVEGVLTGANAVATIVIRGATATGRAVIERWKARGVRIEETGQDPRGYR